MSTPPHENGVLTTCVDQPISFTCSYANVDATTTVWMFSPPTATVCSVAIDHENPQVSTQCDPFTVQDISNTTQAMFTSTAVATATTSLTGTVAECDDGIGAGANQIGSNISICVIGKILLS